MKSFFSPLPIWQSSGLALIRIIVGFFMVYHGWEVFDSEKMNGYIAWDNFKNSSLGTFLPYLGKASELVGGIMLVLGFFTRIACIILIGTMLYISLFVGHGKIWYDDQHPFLFVLLAFVFIFCGPGKWSIDNIIFNQKK